MIINTSNYASNNSNILSTTYDGWTKSGTTLYTAHLTRFVGIGTDSANQNNSAYKLQIYASTYTTPLLVIGAGIEPYNNNQECISNRKPFVRIR